MVKLLTQIPGSLTSRKVDATTPIPGPMLLMQATTAENAVAKSRPLATIARVSTHTANTYRVTNPPTVITTHSETRLPPMVIRNWHLGWTRDRTITRLNSSHK